MFDKLRWWLFAGRLPVISPPGSLATKRSHLATKWSFLATSNLIRQWIKERGIISICDSIWLGANSPWGETGSYHRECPVQKYEDRIYIKDSLFSLRARSPLSHARERRKAKRAGVKESGEEAPISRSWLRRARFCSNACAPTWACSQARVCYTKHTICWEDSSEVAWRANTARAHGNILNLSYAYVSCAYEFKLRERLSAEF